MLDIVSSCVRDTLYCDYTLWVLVSYKYTRETRRSHRVQMSDFSFFFTLSSRSCRRARQACNWTRTRNIRVEHEED